MSHFRMPLMHQVLWKTFDFGKDGCRVCTSETCTCILKMRKDARFLDLRERAFSRLRLKDFIFYRKKASTLVLLIQV